MANMENYDEDTIIYEEQADDYKNDPDYVPEEYTSEDGSETEQEEDEVARETVEDNNTPNFVEEEEDDKLKDPDYVPEEYTSEDGSETEQEEYEVAREPVEDNNNPNFVEEEEDDYKNDPDYVPESETSEDGSEYDENEVEQEQPQQHFGCDGCDYEWKDGWKHGWKAAIKYVRKQMNIEVPLPPTCNYCGMSSKTLKCGGACGGAVRYCSVKCQTIDWKSNHKYECSL
uniref:MYND-type domain-containing protein n=1 Tax=viral metagenome TaxID=1070528 RepID=A0A6C0II53_9ZZZZ